MLGVILGGISGYYGGWIDIVIQRVIEVISCDADDPALARRSRRRCRSTWSPLQVYFVITLILSLIGWTGLARVVRGRFLALRSEDFVTAARLDGSSEARLIFRHMLPSLTSHIIAVVTLAHPGDDPRRDRAVLPRPRPPAAGRQLGRAAAGGAEHPLDRHRAVAASGRRARSCSRCSPSTSSATACATPPIRTSN